MFTSRVAGGSLTLRPSQSGREPLDSSGSCHPVTRSCPATSAHSCDSFLTVDHTHQPGRPHPLAPPPLRYAGTSQLLRVSPPARPATVLGSLRIPPLGVLPLATNCSVTVSRRAFTCSVREPGPDSCCLYAGHHLGSRRVTPRLIPEQRPNPGFDVISLAFDASVGRGPFDPSLIFPVHT